MCIGWFLTNLSFICSSSTTIKTKRTLGGAAGDERHLVEASRGYHTAPTWNYSTYPVLLSRAHTRRRTIIQHDDGCSWRTVYVLAWALPTLNAKDKEKQNTKKKDLKTISDAPLRCNSPRVVHEGGKDLMQREAADESAWKALVCGTWRDLVELRASTVG